MSEPVVALYAHRLGPGQGTGISAYVRDLIPALAGRSAFRYHMCGSREGPEDRPPEVPLPLLRPPVHRVPLHAAWTWLGRPAVDRWVGSPDLVHVLYPSTPVPSRAPVVYTVHDLMPLSAPEWYAPAERRMFTRAVGDAARRGAAIITDSTSTALQVQERLAVPPERLHVVPLGVNGVFTADVPAEAVASVCVRHRVTPGSYIVALGAVSARKNLAPVISALAAGLPRALHLMVVGPVARGGGSVVDQVGRLNLGDRVHFTGWLPPDEVSALLHGAAALVHPSLDEGFGLTPLEAMSAGVPAIVSAAGALPETVGEAGIQVGADEPQAWADAIARVVEDSDLRSELVRAGQRRAGEFTWDRTARETEAVYARVLGASGHG